MIKSYFKSKTPRNEDYLDFIREKSCENCTRSLGRITKSGKIRNSEAHHVRRHWLGSGTSQKPTDYAAIPLCPEFPNGCHNAKTEKNLDVEYIILNNLFQYARKRYGKFRFKINADNEREAILQLIEQIEKFRKVN